MLYPSFLKQTLPEAVDSGPQLSFGVFYVLVAQKLRFYRIWKKKILAWPLPIWRPPEARILTSATSMGSQILADDTSFVILFVDKNENLDALDFVLQNVLPQPPGI